MLVDLVFASVHVEMGSFSLNTVLFCFLGNGFLKLTFIAVLLLYKIVLISAVEQSESAIRVHVSPLFLDFLPI